MTNHNGVGWTNGKGWPGVDLRPWPDEDPSEEDLARSDFQLWRVYDAGGPVVLLKVRYCDGVEVLDWRRGPDLTTALQQAEAQGWHAFDSEPGNAPREHSIVHLRRALAW